MMDGAEVILTESFLEPETGLCSELSREYKCKPILKTPLETMGKWQKAQGHSTHPLTHPLSLNPPPLIKRLLSQKTTDTP